MLVNSEAEASFSETYQRFIGRHVHFPTLTFEKKRLVMRLSLANDVNVLASILNRLSERNRLFRDFTLNALTGAVREVIACFPVYRTYLEHGHPPGPEDRAVVNRAVATSPSARTRASRRRSSTFCATSCCSVFRRTWTPPASRSTSIS